MLSRTHQSEKYSWRDGFFARLESQQGGRPKFFSDFSNPWQIGVWCLQTFERHRIGLRGKVSGLSRSFGDPDLHENVLRRWGRERSADLHHAFPGHGQMKLEQQEIDRLRKEVAKLKAERNILRSATF